ncbi:MAG: threonine synthase [Alphaproteobacteria bacterium]|nr:threonine synthase [Alphaproteobacteria bacterium]
MGTPGRWDRVCGLHEDDFDTPLIPNGVCIADRREKPDVNHVSHLECSATGERHEAGEVHGLSRAGWPLLVRYDLDRLANAVTRESLVSSPVAGFWRWAPLLPVARERDRISLGEVTTPLVTLVRSVGETPTNVMVKDEGRLPTGSFKARGLALAVSMARQLGLHHLAIPTNGNAGAALAAYAGRAGMKSTVLCPADTPDINLREIRQHGADVWKVDGLINDCGRIVGEGARTAGWFDVSTLKEPYRIEGKKTMGLELAWQMDWSLPDVIFYPTGGGTGLIGMWKAFQELRQLGWIAGGLPRMVAVQATGCAPIVRAFEAGSTHAVPWQDAHTVAAGIRVPVAIGDFLILDAIRASGGFAMAIDDESILQERDRVAMQDGLLLAPEGAATVAAWRRALENGLVGDDERVVLFNCASGLKYPMAPVNQELDITQDIDFTRFA